MNKYEAMCIVKPDLAEEERKTLFSQINDAITKNQGSVTQASLWSERRKLFFPIKRQHEGLYYLVNFTMPPSALPKIREAYKLNDGILRVLITRQDK